MHSSDEEESDKKAHQIIKKDGKYYDCKSCSVATKNALVSTNYTDFIIKEVSGENQELVVRFDDDNHNEFMIPCECGNSRCGDHAPKRKYEDYSDYEEEQVVFERGEMIECKEAKGKVCVEYKRKFVSSKNENMGYLTDDKKPKVLGPNTIRNIPSNLGQNIACECGSVDCSCKNSKGKDEPYVPPVIDKMSWACKQVYPCDSKEPVWSCKPIQPGEPIVDREPVWSCIPSQPGDGPNEKKWSCELIQPGGTIKTPSNNEDCTNCEPLEPPPQPAQLPQSCYPYKIRKKQKDGQCPKNLYTYEIIRNLPYDEECRCFQKTEVPEVFSTRSDDNEAAIGSLEKPKSNRRSNQPSSDDTKLSDKGKSIRRLSAFSYSDYGKCDCFPDLNCQCPLTGEYKAISRDKFTIVTEPKTTYLENPCMQEYIVPCGTDEQENGLFSDQGDPFCMDSKGERIIFKGMPNVCSPRHVEPCCPCPKPDPDPDHPNYLNTKLNVTELMKQMITFHYNRTLMNQYYGRLIADDEDVACTTCCSIIEEAAGCVSECCKCPKPEPPPCCTCKSILKDTKSNASVNKKTGIVKKSCTCEKKPAKANCLKEFENKYGAIIDEVNKVINSKNISNEPRSNRQLLHCYNAAVSTSLKPEDELSNYEKLNVLTDENQEPKKEIKSVKRFFNFSRKKEETAPISEQQSKRKTIKEFLMGIRKDMARKKSLAQKQEENEP